MKRLLILSTVLLSAVTSACTQSDSDTTSPLSQAYYVAADGDDAHSGRTADSPWKTLEHLNQTTFQPGDNILLRSGDTWTGQLHPTGSGSPGKPIRIDRYGTGPLPIINLGAANGGGGAAVKLTNQDWWTIQNLEITSGLPPQPGIGRQGIVAQAGGAGGHTSHITIRNCYIHDLWGQLGGTGSFTGYNSAGIFVGPVQGRGGGGGGGRGAATGPAGGGGRGAAGGAGGGAAATAPQPGADDILIESNRIERVDRCGIILWQAHNNIIVRGNTLENLGGDAIFMNGCRAGLMERNIVRSSCLRTGDPDLTITGNYNPHSAAMWIQNCTDTIMQYNQAYDTGRQKGNGDGNAYDFDFTCRNCIAQYNYSRNNHGFLLIMNRATANIARYNLSENDQTHLIQMHGTLAEGNLIHNNIFYVDYGTIDIDFYMGNAEIPDENKRQLGAQFSNNIFYATGQGRFRTVYTFGSALERKFLDQVQLTPPSPSTGPLFRRNCYFGPWLNGLPNDPQPLLADPLFLAPGGGETGNLPTLTGYQLHPNSPCIHTGLPLPPSSIPSPHDFYGNPLHPNSPSLGIFEPPH